MKLFKILFLKTFNHALIISKNLNRSLIYLHNYNLPSQRVSKLNQTINYLSPEIPRGEMNHNDHPDGKRRGETGIIVVRLPADGIGFRFNLWAGKY